MTPAPFAVSMGLPPPTATIRSTPSADGHAARRIDLRVSRVWGDVVKHDGLDAGAGEVLEDGVDDPAARTPGSVITSARVPPSAAASAPTWLDTPLPNSILVGS